MSVIQHFPYGKAKVMDSQKSHHKPLSSLCSAAQGPSRVAAEPASDTPLLYTGRVVSMSVSQAASNNDDNDGACAAPSDS